MSGSRTLRFVGAFFVLVAIPSVVARVIAAVPADELCRAQSRHYRHESMGAMVREPKGVREPDLHVPLMINLSESRLTRPEVRAILTELDRIYAQAGICFEVRDISLGYAPPSELVLWFVADDVPFLNGYYESNSTIWSEDAPRLRHTPQPARSPAARTAAHELGHAFGLHHVVPVGGRVSSLMNTGHDGIDLSPEEIATVRRAAARFVRGPRHPECRPPML